MRVHYLFHVPFEATPGAVGTWVQARGHSTSATHLYAAEPLPTPADVDLLVVFGGPMNVDQTADYPWLAVERAFIRQCIAADCAVLGLCLGAQLVAAALGASVRQHAHAEIGWFPIEWTAEAQAINWLAALPSPLTVLHWHGDSIELTPAMRLLARSDGCSVQAFSVGQRVLGLQFHLEITPAELARMVTYEGAEIGTGPWEQSAQVLLAEQRFYASSAQALHAILDGLATGQQATTAADL